jgi:hypothetical protein
LGTSQTVASPGSRKTVPPIDSSVAKLAVGRGVGMAMFGAGAMAFIKNHSAKSQEIKINLTNYSILFNSCLFHKS